MAFERDKKSKEERTPTMTVGRFFANSSVVTGLMLGAANTIIAQPDWGYPLVGEKPTPTPDELKNLVDGGWFGWPVWAWVALAVAIIALLLHFIWRRRGNSALPPSPPQSPTEGGDGKFLGDINIPPDSSKKKGNKPPATNVRWEIKRVKAERKGEGEKPSEIQIPAFWTSDILSEDAGKGSGKVDPSPVAPQSADSEPTFRCGQCDAPIKEGAKFCTSCGRDLNATVLPSREVTVEPPPLEEKKETDEQKGDSIATSAVEPTQEETVASAPSPSPSNEQKEVTDNKKSDGSASAASAATGIVMLALVMLVFAGFANAAPVIDYCTPPLLAWDGQVRNFECVGTSLAGLSGAKITNIPEVTGTVVRSTATTVTLRLKAERNINASYNSADFVINGNRVGKPIMLVSPQEAGKFAFLRNAILREAKILPATTGAGTSTATTPPVVDKQARKDAAEALRLAREVMAKSGRSDPAAMSRIIALEESLKTRLTEAEILTIARKEAETATANLRPELDGAKREVSTTLETFRKEMRASLDKAEATTRALDGRLTTLETTTARDRAVLQATACAVVADNGGWLGQGPSNRHKKAIRAASTSAGYPACPKK